MAKRIIDITPPSNVREVKKAEVRPPRKLFSPPESFPKKILIAPFLIALGVLAYFTLSRAEISIWPKTETLVLETKLVMPGDLIAVEKTISDEFLSSGKKTLEQKAGGQVRIYNNYQSEQVLVANTRLQPPLEKFVSSLSKEEKPWFRIVERVTIPAKSYLDVKVAADSPGEKYNIKSSKFSIPGLAGTAQYTQIYGESFQEFKGGQKQEVGQVSKEDLARAQKELTDRGKQESVAELLAKIPLELEFLEDSFKTETISTSSLVKTEALVEKFNYQVKIKSEALAFKKEDLKSFAKEALLSKTPEGKKINESSLKINSSVFSFDPKTKNLTLSVKLEAQIYSDFNEFSLKGGLSGLSLAEAKFFLENQPQIERSQIRLWPFWQRKIPKNEEKINLRLNLD